MGTVLSEPGGLSYMYTRGSSRLQFETNGWMIRYEVADEDRSDFEPTVEALFTAAPPVTVNGEAIRVPRGATYQYPIFADTPEDYIGLPEEAPNLHVIRRGESLISFDSDGTIIVERIDAEDADDFGEIVSVLDK